MASSELEYGLQQLLVADADVTALIETRLYPILLPHDPTLPAATYHRISTVRDYATTGPVGLTRVRMQIDTWALTYVQAKALAAATQKALECYTGVLPNGTYVETIQLDSCFDLFDDVARYFRVSSDFIVYAAL